MLKLKKVHVSKNKKQVTAKHHPCPRPNPTLHRLWADWRRETRASNGQRWMEDLPERRSPPEIGKCEDMSRAGQSFDYKGGISKYPAI